MIIPIVAYSLVFLVALMFGSLPFVGRFRAFPRWIRIALFMIGLCFFIGGAVLVAVRSAGDSISPPLHHFIFLQAVLIFGMAIGLLLLLLFSGDFVKALRALLATRRKHSSDTHEGRDNKHV
jgi:hypothetical protein